MSNVTINALPVANTIDPVNDYLPIFQNSSTSTLGINRNTLLGLASAPVGLTDSQTLTNKILTSPTISGPTLSGTITGAYTIGGTPTFPSSVATLTGSQTLTNKTLTSPIINSPTITNATLSADVITGFSVSTSGTIYGIAISSGTISGANTVSGGALTSNSVPSAAIQANAITTAKLATGSNFTPVTVMQNPYKFGAYHNTTQSSASGSKLAFNTKDYDTSSNFDNVTNNRFTAPIAGFYHFESQAYIEGSSNGISIALYKNGSLWKRGSFSVPAGNDQSSDVSETIQLAAADYVEVYYTGTSTRTILGDTSRDTSFSGFLISAT